jgi:D-arginine dehydrogenase
MWPFVEHDEAPHPFYFKPEAGDQLLCSPADETPFVASDAKPQDLDIARAIESINTMTTLDIRSVRASWAGLRTFTPDRGPVIGWDDHVEGFFWLVGQGGAGIQTSPAAGMTAAALVEGKPLPGSLEELGLTREALGPRR